MPETVPTKHHHQLKSAGEEWFAQQRPGELQEHSEQHEWHAQQADQLDPEERRPDDQGEEPAGGRHHGHGGEDLKDFCPQVGKKHIFGKWSIISISVAMTLIVNLQRGWWARGEEDDPERARGL